MCVVVACVMDRRACVCLEKARVVNVWVHLFLGNMTDRMVQFGLLCMRVCDGHRGGCAL